MVLTYYATGSEVKLFINGQKIRHNTVKVKLISVNIHTVYPLYDIITQLTTRMQKYI